MMHSQKHTSIYPPCNKDFLIQILTLRHKVYQRIRDYFINRGYIEVETPIMVRSPGVDQYIDAISVEGNMYLATSPELQMKRLLGMGMGRIFQFTRAFRKGEEGKQHNPEFSLLEWYCPGEDYQFMMDEVEALIREVTIGVRDHIPNPIKLPETSFPRYTIDELFQIHANWIPSRDWDEERFFYDLVNKIESFLLSEPAIIIYDFPSPLASLARLKPSDPYICERFELYLNGLEVANAFSELTDPIEQKERFIMAQEGRKKMGKEPYPIDKKFLCILEDGLLSPCTGIAMGLDRLIMALTGQYNIQNVMAFPLKHL